MKHFLMIKLNIIIGEKKDIFLIFFKLCLILTVLYIFDVKVWVTNNFLASGNVESIY